MSKCINCVNNTLIYGTDEQFRMCDTTIDNTDESIERECEYFTARTNADRIRNMTDEELLDFIHDVSTNCTEVTICQGKCIGCTLGEDFCKNGYRKWLQKEVEE